jgi:hypothetical protein
MFMIDPQITKTRYRKRGTTKPLILQEFKSALKGALSGAGFAWQIADSVIICDPPETVMAICGGDINHGVLSLKMGKDLFFLPFVSRPLMPVPDSACGLDLG